MTEKIILTEVSGDLRLQYQCLSPLSYDWLSVTAGLHCLHERKLGENIILLKLFWKSRVK